MNQNDKRELESRRAIEEFNKSSKIGMTVTVKDDNGVLSKTITASDAFLLGGHTACIMLENKRGAYNLTRVKKVN